MKKATQAVKNGVQRALEAAVKVSNRYCLWSASLLGADGELTEDGLMDGKEAEHDSDFHLPATAKVSAALQLWHKRQADMEKLYAPPPVRPCTRFERREAFSLTLAFASRCCPDLCGASAAASCWTSRVSWSWLNPSCSGR